MQNKLSNRGNPAYHKTAIFQIIQGCEKEIYHVWPEFKDNKLQDQFTFQKMSKTAAVTKPRRYKLIIREGKCGRT